MADEKYLGFDPDGGGYRFEPLRKFRWELRISGDQEPLTLVLLTCARPEMNFASTEVHHFNDRFYLAGKPEFSEIEFSMYDARVDSNKAQNIIDGGKFASKILEEWRDLVYDPRTSRMLPAEPVDGGGYKKNCELVQFDGVGNSVLRWQLLGCFPRVVNFNDLDYSSSDACLVNCTLRIDKAYII